MRQSPAKTGPTLIRPFRVFRGPIALIRRPAGLAAGHARGWGASCSLALC